MERLNKIKQQLEQHQTRTEYGFADEGRIGIIYLNSKKDANAMTLEMKTELIHKVRVLCDNPIVKVIVILSKLEKIFCAGANIKDFNNVTYESQQYSDIFTEMDRMLNETQKVMIAGVHGGAYGGGFEIALACDMVLTREGTLFGLPEINLGLIPGWGGTQRLTKLIGKNNASRHILSGEPINSKRAYELGIVQEVYPKETLEQFHENVIKFAHKFSSKALHTLLIAKKAVQAAQNMGLNDGINYERSIFNPLFSTKAKEEGVNAFISKRKPNFNDL